MGSRSRGAGRRSGLHVGDADWSRRSFLSRSAAMGVPLLGAGTLGGCGIMPMRSDPSEVRWSTWGNPGEIGRMQDFTDDYNKRHPDRTAILRPVPSDSYKPRILTQLGGGTAPDVFYTYDNLIHQLIIADLILPLRERLEGPDSVSRPDEFFDPLWGAARDDSGEIWGVSVDCNPIVLWYNTNVLADAGVSELPAAMFEAGTWTIDEFTNIVEAVRRSGRRAAALGSNWQAIYSWMTARGGQVYADGRFVAHEDPASVETFVWLSELVESGAFVYAGSLPEGQGQEALFMSNNLAFAMSVGRWVLPIFRENENLKYDVAPYPTPDGAQSSAPVAVAYMVLNKDATNPDNAFRYLSEFVSRRGQMFRLQGQGNAVPSIRGADEVVLEGGMPEHAENFLRARDNGYALPVEEARVPGLGTEIEKRFGLHFAEGTDPVEVLKSVGQVINDAIERGSLV